MTTYIHKSKKHCWDVDADLKKYREALEEISQSVEVGPETARDVLRSVRNIAEKALEE